MITQKTILKTIQHSQDNGGIGIARELKEIEEYDGFGITENIDKTLANLIHQVDPESSESLSDMLNDLDYAIDKLEKARTAYHDLVNILL